MYLTRSYRSAASSFHTLLQSTMKLTRLKFSLFSSNEALGAQLAIHIVVQTRYSCVNDSSMVSYCLPDPVTASRPIVAAVLWPRQV